MTWQKNSKNNKPDLHVGVLVAHELGAGGLNYDVASYAGKDAGGMVRWILSGGVEVKDDCITHWKVITSPEDEAR